MKKLLKHLAMRSAVVINAFVAVMVVSITMQWFSDSDDFLENFKK